jgi:hypothetical protein
MSSSDGQRKPYAYNFQVQAAEEAAISRASLETLASIKDTLVLLTSGCEITLSQTGRRCERHQLPVNGEGDRCGYLASRFAASTEDQKSLIQQYVNETLGVRNPKVAKRLTG